MYAELSYGVSQDAELLALAARTRIGQPPPNMLYAAVHYLLLGGAEHDLRMHYPALTGEPRPSQPAFPAFRDFCLHQLEPIADLLRTRRTQTNVIQRCACLLPAFTTVHLQTGRPLAALEIGPSAGLNLNWDRYRYQYFDSDDRVVTSWGEADAPLLVSSVLRGAARPRLTPFVPMAWHRGIDLDPIDVDDADQMRWLQALIWPEHVARHEQLRQAAELARQHPPLLVKGDATLDLTPLLAQIPADAAPLVYATHVLYQIDREGRIRLFKALQAFADEHGRRIDMVTMESSGGDDSQLALHTYTPGGRVTCELARVNPHGWWLRWRDSPRRST
jgi:hypothetical protein